MVRYSPSLIAASAVYLAVSYQNGKRTWPPVISELSQKSEASLQECVEDILVLLSGIKLCTLTAIQKKFSLRKFYGVVNIDFSGLIQNVQLR